MKIKIYFILFISFLIFMSCSGKKDIFKRDSILEKEEQNNHTFGEYWTSDINEIELVMSYILSNRDYIKLNQLDNSEKFIFLNNYWKSIDPDTTTIDNELLVELSFRANKAKELFSGFDVGLHSDRGRIFILYGPPNQKDISSMNNVHLITWYYNLGYVFNFEDNGFGRYKLID